MSDAAPNKIAPEAVTLRAQPRPVTRLNRRTLAALVGGFHCHARCNYLVTATAAAQYRRPDRAL